MKRTRLLVAIAGGTALALAGCVVTYPITSIFRSPDQVHGIVIDQDGRRIPRATLVFDEWEHVPYVPIPFGPTSRFSRQRSVTTNDLGEFDIEFKRLGLGVTAIIKDGYFMEPFVLTKGWLRREVEEQRRTAQSATFLSYDVRNPNTSIIHTASTTPFRFAADGTDYYVDLVNGRIQHEADNSADLVFSVRQIDTALWLLSIRSVDGGVCPASNEMPYAPRIGYIPGFGKLYNNRAYRDQYFFYARSRNGNNYSRVIAEIVKKDQTIRFHYILNPTGSRFLFVPERIIEHGIHRGIEGPLNNHKSDNGNAGYYVFGEIKPWWQQISPTISPILRRSEIDALMNNDGGARDFLAEKLFTPVEILDILSRSAQFRERWAVAGNPAASRSILERLSRDTDEAVKLRAREMLDRNLPLAEYLRSRHYFSDTR